MRRPSPGRAKAKAVSKSRTSSRASCAVRSPTPKSEHQEAKEQILFQFKRLDTNGDGFISLKELAFFMQDLDSDRWTPERLRELLSLIDKNDDGRIQFSEFLEWVFSVSKATHTEGMFASILESSPKHPTYSHHSYELWKVVYPAGVIVRAAMDRGSERIGFKQHGEFVLGHQVSNWVSLDSEPGFMCIKTSSAKLLERQFEEPPLALDKPTALSRPSRFTFVTSEAKEGRTEPPDRFKLQELYVQDVLGGKLVSGMPPPKPLLENVLRVVQWNINALQGHDSCHAQDPAEIVQLFRRLNPDILVLNEAAIRPAEIEDSGTTHGSDIGNIARLRVVHLPG